MIEFDAVTKVYPGGTVAVDNLSLIAPTGRVTVVVGPAGCGKTTLLRMVNRLVDPSAGRVLIDGAANTLLRRSALRRGIGYVISGGGLFPHRTVIENIETVPLLVGTRQRQARDMAHALLERVGLSQAFADRYPGQLSTGQQLRVAVARALAADPPILLFDEPFSTLDPVVRGDLQDDLLDLQQAAPKTVLFVTHDIDEAIKLGDQIAVMDGAGHLVQLATPETLLVHPGSDFVGDFLGRDRGIRKLAFLPAEELPLAEAATVQAGATGARARAISGQHGQRWLLVLDPDRHPRGWVDTSAMTADDVVSGPAVYPLGGTFYPDESVLAALDAAVLSPPGLAVCIDDEGLVLGVVSHAEVARYLAARGPSTLPRPLGETTSVVAGVPTASASADPGLEKSESGDPGMPSSSAAAATPAQATPAQATPAQETPAQETPAQETPAQGSPGLAVPPPVVPSAVAGPSSAGQSATPAERAKAEPEPSAEVAAPPTPAAPQFGAAPSGAGSAGTGPTGTGPTGTGSTGTGSTGSGPTGSGSTGVAPPTSGAPAPPASVAGQPKPAPGGPRQPPVAPQAPQAAPKPAKVQPAQAQPRVVPARSTPPPKPVGAPPPRAGSAAAAAPGEDPTVSDDLYTGRWEWDAAASKWVRVPDSEEGSS